MKYSKQRELIEVAVRECCTHPSADEIYALLKPQNPNLSLGTVYRNLNMLTEIGSIRKVTLPNMVERFDAKTSPHHHIVCNQCKKIFDVDLLMPAAVETAIWQKTGVRVTNHQFVAYGLCSQCSP